MRCRSHDDTAVKADTGTANGWITSSNIPTRARIPAHNRVGASLGRGDARVWKETNGRVIRGWEVKLLRCAPDADIMRRRMKRTKSKVHITGRDLARLVPYLVSQHAGTPRRHPTVVLAQLRPHNAPGDAIRTN